MTWWRAGWLAAVLLGCGASSRVPTPRSGEHPTPLDRWQEVETPPPPVEVEELTPAPAGYVWLDGQWLYQPMTRRWVWEQGRWCREPPGALYYAAPRLARERKARIVDGEVQRVVRWNELYQRYEEVDVMVDRWRWIPGTFYVRGATGQPVPWVGELTCVSQDNGR